MREKHRTQRRGWLKVHVAIDVESKKLLPLEVAEENTSDSEALRPLLKNANFEDALAGDAYDTNNAFEFMKYHHLGTVRITRPDGTVITINNTGNR